MDSINNEVLRTVNRWLHEDQRVWLCTIVSTWGSSPRPIGSLLACNPRAEVTGSLSGGCVEEDLIEKLVAGEVASETPQLVKYGVKKEESDRLGLPCGGQLKVVCEPLFPDSTTVDGFKKIATFERLYPIGAL